MNAASGKPARIDGPSPVEEPWPDRLATLGLGLRHTFLPGDVGELIRIHGEQNAVDYGFGPAHEAYCARIVADFVLEPQPRRARAWLVTAEGALVGSVFITELPGNVAQLRLLFVHACWRGRGLGRWLVRAAVGYARASGFGRVFLWTVRGLDRAIGIYENAGFRLTKEKGSAGWGDGSVEVRYDLAW